MLGGKACEPEEGDQLTKDKHLGERLQLRSWSCSTATGLEVPGTQQLLFRRARGWANLAQQKYYRQPNQQNRNQCVTVFVNLLPIPSRCYFPDQQEHTGQYTQHCHQYQFLYYYVTFHYHYVSLYHVYFHSY